MEMYNTLVINVISKQHGKDISKHIKPLFMELCGLLVISVISKQHGKDISKHIKTLFMLFVTNKNVYNYIYSLIIKK